MKSFLPILLLAALPAAATDYHWKTGSSGTFATPGNWNPTGPPAPGDNAILDAAGTYTVTVGANASVASVQVGAATAFVTLSISNGATLTITGSGSFLTNGSGVTNAGTIDFQNTTQFGWNGGGTSTTTVTNTGTIKKTAGAGASGFASTALTSSGTLDSELNSLSFSGGGTISGPVTNSSGAEVALTGTPAFTIASGASFSGAGTLRVATFFATVVSADVTIPHLRLDNGGGGIGGTGNVTITGTLDWEGSGFTGAATTTIALGAVGTIPNASVVIDQSRTLVNAGTLNQSAGLNGGSGTSIQNSGTWSFLGDIGLGNVPTITNTGTFRKTGGTGTSILEVGGGTMTSSGTVEAQSGTLNLNVTLNSSGSLVADPGATLSFTGTTSTIASNGTFSGEGTFLLGDFSSLDVTGPHSIPNLTIAGGTLQGSGDVTITSSLTWTAGGMTGSGSTTIANGAVAAFPPNANAPNLSRTLNVMGTLLDQNASSNPVLVNGASVNVSGTFDVQSDKKLAGSNGATLAVSGTMKKSFGGGTYTLENVAIHNTGAVQAKTGTLALTGSSVLTQTAGSTSLLGGGLSSANAIAIQGGSLGGAGTITGNVANSGGHVAPGSSPGTLAISGAYTQGAAASLDVQIASLASYDVLAVTGATSLAGTLNPSLLNGFVPAQGNAFPVLTFGSATGTFGALTGNTGLSMSWAPHNMSLVKNANACGVHGDADGDGSVTLADVFYDINYLFAGGPPPVCWGDANGDGLVSLPDVFYLINYLFAGGPAPP
jgi:fibronectin-binding autotransporter adhesin